MGVSQKVTKSDGGKGVRPIKQAKSNIIYGQPQESRESMGNLERAGKIPGNAGKGL